MSLLANGFLLLDKSLMRTPAMFCLLWPCHFCAPGAPVGSWGEALSKVRRPNPSSEADWVGAGGYAKTTAGSFGIYSAYLAFTITRFFILFIMLLYN